MLKIKKKKFKTKREKKKVKWKIYLKENLFINIKKYQKLKNFKEFKQKSYK